MNLIIIFGPPYSGKGTQCKLLSQELGYKHLSTGELCRREKGLGTKMGRKIEEYESKGELVPDEVITDLVFDKLDWYFTIGVEGIILDGYPRTLQQAQDFSSFLFDRMGKINLESVFNFSFSIKEKELLERAAKRALASDREDDKDPEIHKKRIEIFWDQTMPAIEYLSRSSIVRLVDADRTIDEVFDDIMSVINSPTNMYNRVHKKIQKKIDAKESLNVSEASCLLEEVLDTLVEVGNGITEGHLHKACDQLFAFRDLWFKNTHEMMELESLKKFEEMSKKLSRLGVDNVDHKTMQATISAEYLKRMLGLQ